MKKAHIDFGHGGKDPGACGNGFKEKDVTLSIGMKVVNILKNHGVKTTTSRTSDKFVSLYDRAKIANNANADVFVSIHANAAGNSNAQGVETFSFPNSKDGAKLAKCIQNSIIHNRVYTKNRGVKTANFAVLRQTKMPSVLVETAFITNKEDASILRNKQDELARAIAKGILEFLGIEYRNDNNIKPTKVYFKDNIMDGFINDGRTYVELRKLCEVLDLQVNWDNKTKTTEVVKNG